MMVMPVVIENLDPVTHRPSVVSEADRHELHAEQVPNVRESLLAYDGYGRGSLLLESRFKRHAERDR